MDENTSTMSLSDYYAAIKAEHDSNNAWSAEQAQKAMEWQAQQSATAHQREVADLKAAGLNPVLSAGGQGATTGSGIAAQRSDENVQALYGLVKESLKANMAQANAMQNTAKYISGSAGGSNSIASSLGNQVNNVKNALSKVFSVDSDTKSTDELLDALDKGVADALASKIPGVSGTDVYKAMQKFDNLMGSKHSMVNAAYSAPVSTAKSINWKEIKNKVVKFLGL